MCSFLLSVEIQIMNFVYRKVAVWTTERENHRTDTRFEDVLIVKLAVFQVCSWARRPGGRQRRSRSAVVATDCRICGVFFRHVL